MNKLVAASIAAVAACACWCLCETAWAIRAGREALPLVESRLVARVDAALTKTSRSVDQSLLLANSQVTALRRDITELADKRAGEALGIADRQITDLRGQLQPALNETTRTIASTGDLARNADSTVVATRRHFEPWIDCGGTEPGTGKDCIQQHLWMNTLKLDNVLSEVAIAVPKVTDSADKTAQSVSLAAASAAQTARNIEQSTRPAHPAIRYALTAGSLALPYIGIFNTLYLSRALGR